jgi:hypothetical protein
MMNGKSMKLSGRKGWGSRKMGSLYGSEIINITENAKRRLVRMKFVLREVLCNLF